MSRAEVIVRSHTDRARIAAWAAKCPFGTRVSFKAVKRTTPQNDLMWSMLTSVSRQVEWYGQKLTPTDWKDVFTAALREERVVPGIDPGTFVRLGLHTSDLSKDEMSALIDLISAFAAERDVDLGDKEAA